MSQFSVFLIWQEEIVKLIKYAEQTSGNFPNFSSHIFGRLQIFVGFDTFSFTQEHKGSPLMQAAVIFCR